MYYLVYNASVLYWQLLRPFMRTNFLSFLAPSLQLLCRLLEDVREPDVHWRAELLLLLLSAQLDANDRAGASATFTRSMQFLREQTPREFREAFALAARHSLLDVPRFQKDQKLSAQLSLSFRLARLRAYVHIFICFFIYFDCFPVSNRSPCAPTGHLKMARTK